MIIKYENKHHIPDKLADDEKAQTKYNHYHSYSKNSKLW
jgi:hypothetical protein